MLMKAFALDSPMQCWANLPATQSQQPHLRPTAYPLKGIPPYPLIPPYPHKGIPMASLASSFFKAHFTHEASVTDTFIPP